MINIVFNPEELELSITGHSNHGEKGKDIVCAAVSTLFYTLGQCLDLLKDMLQEAPVLSDEDGNGLISCVPKELYLGNIMRTYWTILVGMELVAKEYPEHVNFTVVEKEKEQ